jgi:L-ectoine synthase
VVTVLIRSLDDIEGTAHHVWWGNGSSKRLLTSADNLGYSLTETTVAPGTESLLRYDNHVEACLCVSGSGWVVDAEGVCTDIKPGTMYAPDKGEEHLLRSAEGMTLICVFAPALRGDETHTLSQDRSSTY